ncbi:hypothetical protein N7527_005211 [Penicillium freii]|uniref:Glycosyl transferase CAP10 domain-containing protein n=1 Tax=Penicillium freii TaxID=48697 RepID=A0A101MCY1_PENFR|nr:hypothetical protein N7527_005211 [Penicillium freii]KUM58279.1 hypothetical protein ACN42_g8877 [Penicillium freii]
MDGHAYSGRFYAFMRSKSVPLKLTFFREWHENVLIPWVHYVPLNKDTDEIAEIVRFFEQDSAGQEIARTICEEGQSWVAKTLRNDDMDVYMFRLMLEYARVQDDRRENLGFIFSAPRHLPLILLAVADGGNILVDINETPAVAWRRDMWSQQMGRGTLKLVCHILVRSPNRLVRFLDIQAHSICLRHYKRPMNRQCRNRVFKKWAAKRKAGHSGEMAGTIIERLCMTG